MGHVDHWLKAFLLGPNLHFEALQFESAPQHADLQTCDFNCRQLWILTI